MAKVETATLESLEPLKHSNTSGIVGIGEKNEIDDVMLIQRIIQTCWLFRLYGKNVLQTNRE